MFAVFAYHRNQQQYLTVRTELYVRNRNLGNSNTFKRQTFRKSTDSAQQEAANRQPFKSQTLVDLFLFFCLAHNVLALLALFDLRWPIL